MISIFFGGAKNDQQFECWLKNQTSYVYRFSPFAAGDLLRFAEAITQSTETIVKLDYWGQRISEEPANDPIVIHVAEEELEKVSCVWPKVAAFFLLAQDAGLEISVSNYNSQLGAEYAQKLIAG